MNERKILIIIDQVDQTKKIAEYLIEDGSVKIRFNKGVKKYSYSIHKIIVKEHPVQMLIHDQMVLKEYGSPIHNVEEVLMFEEFTKVFLENQQTLLCDTSSISLGTNKESYLQNDLSPRLLERYCTIYQIRCRAGAISEKAVLYSTLYT